MKKLIYVFLSLAIVSTFGCGPNRMYYYGSYSNTLYDYRKDSNQENLTKHITELESIVSESKEQNKKVPPGLYGEMGYMYLKTKDTKKAIDSFSREKDLYPESAILMDRMIKKTNEGS